MLEVHRQKVPWGGGGVYFQSKVSDLKPAENALESKIGNFLDYQKSYLAITISRGKKSMWSYTSLDREFQGGSNDMS